MALQKKLQTLRKQKGMTQESLAEKLGITRQAVANWEMGLSCPDLENLIQLSDLFHISLDDFVRDREQEICSNHPPCKAEIENERAIEFLRRAKRSTYAGKGKETISSRPESHDLEYCEEPFYYLDSYLGGERFAGEEVL
ncbi:MAG TPA: helix-turn-helix transcriptional regulator [Caproicibacter sp.]|nr:helix-turn-helix transcriptional regulator [Caproicibacter sp.]